MIQSQGFFFSHCSLHEPQNQPKQKRSINNNHRQPFHPAPDPTTPHARCTMAAASLQHSIFMTFAAIVAKYIQMQEKRVATSAVWFSGSGVKCDSLHSSSGSGAEVASSEYLLAGPGGLLCLSAG